MSDNYVVVIASLLPLAAAMLVFEENPYHALVVRGILGAIAALLYTVLGAPDVALTEALVGTMLAITLYAVAVRSSLVVRLGVLEDLEKKAKEGEFSKLLDQFRKVFKKYHLRLELVSYSDEKALKQALIDKEVHAICMNDEKPQGYHTLTRIQRLYQVMQTQLSLLETRLTYFNLSKSGEEH